jgi:hypothetical protein
LAAVDDLRHGAEDIRCHYRRPGRLCGLAGEFFGRIGSAMGSSAPAGRPGQAIYVAVIGPGDEATGEEVEVARQVGRHLAERQAIVVWAGSWRLRAREHSGAAA